jgi:hypothetical protein
MKKASVLYYNSDPAISPAVSKIVSEATAALDTPLPLRNVSSSVQSLRLIKSEAEISIMKKVFVILLFFSFNIWQ